jgi:nicotinamide-nucleotide amidase
MFLNQVEPLLRPHLEGVVFSRLRVLHIFGQPESTVNERIQPVFRWHPEVQVGILARNYGIDLRIHAHGSTEAETIDLTNRTEEKLRAGLPPEWIYGCDEETLVGAVAERLKSLGLVISTAESCTGGLVAKMLTDPAGSSAYFREGVVTYSNEAKAQNLGVSQEILETHGAVSRECVDAMVRGLRTRTGADVCTAVSGIAGPDGAVPGKPVGTVIVGLSVGDSDPEIHELKLVQDREMNRMLSALSVLNLVRLRLQAQA